MNIKDTYQKILIFDGVLGSRVTKVCKTSSSWMIVGNRCLGPTCYEHRKNLHTTNKTFHRKPRHGTFEQRTMTRTWVTIELFLSRFGYVLLTSSDHPPTRHWSQTLKGLPPSEKGSASPRRGQRTPCNFDWLGYLTRDFPHSWLLLKEVNWAINRHDIFFLKSRTCATLLALRL